EKTQPLKYRIMELRLDVRQSAQIVGEVFVPWHLLLPEVEPLQCFLMQPARRYVSPEGGVVAFRDVMRVDEGAEVVDLSTYPVVVVVPHRLRHCRWRLQEVLREEHHLHGRAVDRCRFQRL